MSEMADVKEIDYEKAYYDIVDKLEKTYELYNTSLKVIKEMSKLLEAE